MITVYILTGRWEFMGKIDWLIFAVLERLVFLRVYAGWFLPWPLRKVIRVIVNHRILYLYFFITYIRNSWLCFKNLSPSPKTSSKPYLFDPLLISTASAPTQHKLLSTRKSKAKCLIFWKQLQNVTRKSCHERLHSSSWALIHWILCSWWWLWNRTSE